MRKIRVGLPNTSIYSSIIQDFKNFIEKDKYEIFSVPEEHLTKLILDNRLDLSLINPLILGKIFKNSDFRIIPSNTLSFISYCDIASIKFEENQKKIEKLIVPNLNDYFSIIAKILLSERYNFFAEIIKKPSVVLNNAIELIYNNLDEVSGQLDFTEDWFDTYEIPLVTGFWIVRNEEEPFEAIELLKQISANRTANEIEIIEKSENTIVREGSIAHFWDNEIKDALEQILQLLFFHQVIDEIPAIKLIN